MSKFTAIAGIFGFLGVALGAFGAHGLEEHLSSNDHLETWQTATLYLFVHTIGLLAVTGFGLQNEDQGLHLVCWFWIGGVVLFSGSLYILALTNISKLGMITPFGGLCFLIGWFLLCKNAFNSWKSSGEGA